MLPIRSRQLAYTQRTGSLAGFAVLALALSCLGSGCAAVTNPVAEGIPVRKLPPEYFAKPRETQKTIAMTLLAQPQPDPYRLDAEDALAVYIEGVLGEKNIPPIRPPDQSNLPPAVGSPVVVREDGTLTLPNIPPLKVRGLSVAETRDLIVKTYIDHKILKANKDGAVIVPVVVSLLRARTIRVQVVRQDTGAITLGTGAISATKRGSGVTLDLPAYENDVLNALNRSGGLPGLDAINEVIIQRNDASPNRTPASPQIVRIPLRMNDGDVLPFHPEDVVLKKGDIVFIEARDTEVYYTAGLLQPRQFALPRDYDLKVTDVIGIDGGPLLNSGLANNLSGNIIATGLGSPSPSHVTVIRRTKINGQIPITVDLNRALRDPRENLIVMPGDIIVLQESVGEAVTRYATGVFQYTFSIFNITNRGSASASFRGF